MRKRLAALTAALCLTVTVTAGAASASCFPRYTGGSGSIAAALDTLGADSSYANREKIAAANGITGYRGTAAQNTRMLELLRQGALIDPSASAFFPKYTGSSESVAVALDAVGTDPSYASREKIAAANGIAGYRGTAAQNTRMLELLKRGALARPDSSAPPVGLVSANLDRVSFLLQDKNTCKATSAAMAVNLILGRSENTTADMIDSGVLCRSLEGEQYTGSDGNTYRAAYRTDRYVGSLGELTDTVEAALTSGLPVVAAVHSAATRHHWIVIVGRDNQGNYLVVDPARNGQGTMASQAKKMSALGYSFGLTDYAEPHYGYIAFQRLT